MPRTNTTKGRPLSGDEKLNPYSVALSPKLVKETKDIKGDISMSQLVRNLLENYVKRNKKK